MQPVPPIPVRLHYDLASSICYVAHRVMERMKHDLDDIGVRLDWTPVDLATLLHWRRGDPLPEVRRSNATRVARDLGVPVRVPPVWLDARRAMAIALRLESGPSAPAWRERVFSAVFEEGRDPGDPSELERWCTDLGLEPEEADIEAGLDELDARTRRAADEMVSGAPTFILGEWPFGGIQEESTMRSVLGRFVARERRQAGQDVSR